MGVLHLAAFAGNIRMLELVLEAPSALDGPSPFSDEFLCSRDKFGRSCLHLAAVRGHASVVRTLHSILREMFQTLVTAKDNDGYTALHHASWAGAPDIVEILLELDDCRYDLLKVQGQYGVTALHQAAGCVAWGHLCVLVGCVTLITDTGCRPQLIAPVLAWRAGMGRVMWYDCFCHGTRPWSFSP